MNYRFMEAHRGEHRVEKMAENLGVRRSGFYAWLQRGKSLRRVADEQLGELIKGIQQEMKHRYGSPRMRQELRRRGRRVGPQSGGAADAGGATGSAPSQGISGDHEIESWASGGGELVAAPLCRTDGEYGLGI